MGTISGENPLPQSNWCPGKVGPLIIPLEGRSEFPDFGHLASGQFLPIFGPLVSVS